MAIFGDFFASCIFSEPYAARFRPASEIRTKASMADIQSATAEIRRGKKKELEMWATAQPDGRPADYRWRPLFNAAKFR